MRLYKWNYFLHPPGRTRKMEIQDSHLNFRLKIWISAFGIYLPQVKIQMGLMILHLTGVIRRKKQVRVSMLCGSSKKNISDYCCNACSESLLKIVLLSLVLSFVWKRGGNQVLSALEASKTYNSLDSWYYCCEVFVCEDSLKNLDWINSRLKRWFLKA